MKRKAFVLSAVASAAVLTSLAGQNATATPAQVSARSDSHLVKSTKHMSTTSKLATSAVSSLRAHPSAGRVASADTFKVVDALQDNTGNTHVRLTREHRGLRVIGGDVVVHRDSDRGFEAASRTIEDKVSGLSVEPAVSAAQAMRKVGVSKGSPELVVDSTGAEPRLAWQVTKTGVQHDGTPSKRLIYVDAKTGKKLWFDEQIQNIDGDGQSLYSGTVGLRLTQSGSSYLLQDPTRGNTFTVDMKNRTGGQGTLFTSTDTHFGDGTNSNRESAAADAQYGSNETWDYYATTFGRQGIFADGTGSSNRVHYGRNYANAYWDGSKMTYGDGNADFGPLVSLDVAGHEMTHGVTQETANLVYSGESGGLNEAMSDIFGTMVEFYANNPNDPGDYLIGEEFDLKRHAGFRRMDDPSKDGQSANCWSSTVGNLDVHLSSGVGNHWFYLASEGSGAKTLNGVSYNSPTCDGSSVTGIGRDAAAKITYRALSVYMTSTTNFAGARTATLKAATDLYGAGSAQYNAIAAAWRAVNVK